MDNTSARLLYCIAAFLLGATSANAATVTTAFAGTGGDLGSSATFGNIEVAAFNSSGEPANLYQANVGTDLGLGVCNTVDDNGLACASPSDSGYNYEIDNHGTSFDWIRIDVSTDKSLGWYVSSINLSSVQYRTWDTWAIWGNDSGTPGSFPASDFISSGNTPLGGNAFVSVDLPVSAQAYSYYYITTAYQTGTTMTDVNESAFMLSKITMTDIAPPAEVPLPPALWLLTSGLGGLLMTARRKA